MYIQFLQITLLSIAAAVLFITQSGNKITNRI